MDKWDYIKWIANIDEYSLIDMILFYNKNNIYEITDNEAKEFFLNLQENCIG